MWRDPKMGRGDAAQSPASPSMLMPPPILRQDIGGIVTVDKEPHRTPVVTQISHNRDSHPHFYARNISASTENIMDEEDGRYGTRDIIHTFRRYMVATIAVVATLSILMGGVVLFLILKFRPSATESFTLTSSGISNYCVPCRSLTISSDPMDDAATIGHFTTHTEIDGTILCCARNYTQLDQLFSLVS